MENRKWKTTVNFFKFKDFKEAIKCINAVGEISESLNHHPKIINVYNSMVKFNYGLIDQNAITDLDW